MEQHDAGTVGARWFAAAAFAVVSMAAATASHAQPGKPAGSAPPPRTSSTAAAAPPSPLPGCSLRGTIPMGKSVEVFDAAVGGNVVARFTGARTPLYVSELPADPKASRTLVATSTGGGDATVRINGWTLAAAIPVFAERDIAAGPHVAIAKGTRVELLRTAADGLEVQLTIAGTSGQTVRTKAACDALALAPPPASEGSGTRQWISKGGSIDLYDQPSGNVVFSLRLDGESVQAFWSTEQRGAFVRVESRSDVVLRGWVRVSDLQPVKPGEVRGKYVPPQAPAGSVVRLPEDPPVARVLREASVHADAERAAKVIGAVEPGAEVYVLSTIAGYVSVLPKNLGIMAPERKGFWIAASEIAR